MMSYRVSEVAVFFAKDTANEPRVWIHIYQRLATTQSILSLVPSVFLCWYHQLFKL